MNIFSIIYLVNAFILIKTQYETIELMLEDNNFYIRIKLGNSKIEEDFLLSTMLPINFFPSSECGICSNYRINEKNKNDYTFIQANVSLQYYYLNMTGDIYRTNITLGSQKDTINFLAVKNIYDLETYNGKGRYSLSFLNYNFNTTNKTFALNLNTDSSELHLGGYDKNKIENEKNLMVFNIVKVNNSLNNLYNEFWFINFKYFSINNNKFPRSNYKVTFDLNTEYFYIPKDLFFSNAHLIFPEEGRCQVQPEGHFVCFCDEFYKKYFSSFTFTNEKNEKIKIGPEDYIYFDNSGSENYCYVYLMLNYENDLFIAGKYVISNYYSIFDIDNSQLKLYPTKKDDNAFFKERNIIIFLVLLFSGIFLLLFCYLIYRKYFFNNQNNPDELNYDFDENNNLIQENENNNENSNENNDNNNDNEDNNKENNDNTNEQSNEIGENNTEENNENLNEKENNNDNINIDNNDNINIDNNANINNDTNENINKDNIDDINNNNEYINNENIDVNKDENINNKDEISLNDSENFTIN